MSYNTFKKLLENTKELDMPYSTEETEISGDANLAINGFEFNLNLKGDIYTLTVKLPESEEIFEVELDKETIKTFSSALTDITISDEDADEEEDNDDAYDDAYDDGYEDDADEEDAEEDNDDAYDDEELIEESEEYNDDAYDDGYEDDDEDDDTYYDEDEDDTEEMVHKNPNIEDSKYFNKLPNTIKSKTDESNRYKNKMR